MKTLLERLYKPSLSSPVHCYREMYQTDSCRGDRGRWSGTAHWTQRLLETTVKGSDRRRSTIECLFGLAESTCALSVYCVLKCSGLLTLRAPRCANLTRHLPDTVDELDEEGGALWVSMVLITVTYALQHNNAVSICALLHLCSTECQILYYGCDIIITRIK